MIFTPTREIFFPHEVMEKNRVLRDFHQLDFLCLQIRDEDLSRFAGHAGKIGEILTRLKQLLKNGVEVGGRGYQFLGCSNSQLRSHSCWFVSPTAQHNPNTIRQWMGDFSHIR
jgi:RNA-dependent RNA polymerase